MSLQKSGRIPAAPDVGEDGDIAEALRLARVAFWRWNVETDQVFWSDEFYELAGRDPSTFKLNLESFVACIHPEDRERTVEKVRGILEHKRTVEKEYRIVRPDGGVVHLWCSTRATIDDKGDVSEVRGISQDITARILAEAALRESEDHYRHAVELNPQIPWTADPLGNILEVGPRWTELTGLSKDQVRGQGWMRCLHPDDLRGTLVAWQDALAAGKPSSAEYRLRLKDGSYRWMRASVAPRLDEAGKVMLWYGAAEDIHDHKLAGQALQESEAFSRSILEASPDCIMVHDLSGQIVYINDGGLQLMEVEKSGSLEKDWISWWPDEHQAAVRGAIAMSASGKAARLAGSCRTFGGEQKWWDVAVSPILDAGGKVERLLSISRDTTAASLAQDEIEKAYDRVSAVLESTTDHVLVLDREWRITYANAGARQLMDRQPGMEMGKILWDVYPELIGSELHHYYKLAMDRQQPVTFETFILSLGMWLEVHAFPAAERLSVFFRDITDTRRAREQIAYLAHHDELTGLPNRAKFSQQLADAFSREDDAEIGVLLLDLDGFKEINDTLGHPVGDALLQQIAGRFREIAGSAGLLARIGGDEFGIIHAVSLSEIDSLDLAGRLVASIATPLLVEGNAIEAGVSIGVAALPRRGHTADDLLKAADIALYRAKAEGRGRYCLFESWMSDALKARQVMKNDLSAAIDNNELEVYYQPLLNIEQGSVSGFEALLRWRHPTLGMVSPGEFIPLAEETGFIERLGEWVLRSACRAATAWPEHVSIAVNLSPVQFRMRNLPFLVADALAQAQLRPARLQLEITETVLLNESQQNLETLHALKELGVAIALDDFGTGYSSLGYLRSFPFDKIKIDRSFIGDIGRSGHSEAIIRAVVGLAHSLDLKVTAEGVEEQFQLDWLRDEGCHEAQGYHIGRPAPLASASRTLKGPLVRETAAA
ncbi:MAG TPA: EAL domain-containing protein [Devosiaceae bacterium]|jgi:diguanylate cyclase (GGDEF)-like protein/PAS domain S-box-containing protein|nr:EAL domain-containing protein [Devosiaceae bacterium]